MNGGIYNTMFKDLYFQYCKNVNSLKIDLIQCDSNLISNICAYVKLLLILKFMAMEEPWNLEVERLVLLDLVLPRFIIKAWELSQCDISTRIKRKQANRTD